MTETSFEDGGLAATSKPPGDASLYLRKQVGRCPIKPNIRAATVTS